MHCHKPARDMRATFNPSSHNVWEDHCFSIEGEVSFQEILVLSLSRNEVFS